MVVLGTGLLVLGLDLGELDLHVVVAGGQRGPSVGRGRGRSDRGIKENKGEGREDTHYAEVFFWPPPTFFASVEPGH